MASVASLSKAALTSPIFQQFNAHNKFTTVSTMAAQVNEDYGYAVLANFIPDKSVASAPASPLVIETFYVDKTMAAIAGYQLTVTKRGLGASLKFLTADGKTNSYIMLADGTIHPLNGAPMPEDVMTEVTCKQIVDALCAVAGSAAGYYTCIALGLTTGLGGLSCVAALALIGLYGCAAAEDKICG